MLINTPLFFQSWIEFRHHNLNLWRSDFMLHSAGTRKGADSADELTVSCKESVDRSKHLGGAKLIRV